MPDLLFDDPELAALYDRMNKGRADFDFYLPMIMAARSVLDVGCGTGALLHEARTSGHTGWLCGLDPAPGMIAQAERHNNVDWVLGDLSNTNWIDAFDLVIMTGHAFQVFVEDEELQAALVTIRNAMTADGKFAFETRNPLVRAWEHWDSERRPAVADVPDASVWMVRTVTSPFLQGRVSFSHTFQSDAWPAPRISHSRLRFLDKRELDEALHRAGLRVEEQFGDWDHSPLTDASPEIITIARPA